MSRELADHLKYYEEIGVAGISRDASWRQRAGEAGDAGDTGEAGEAGDAGEASEARGVPPVSPASLASPAALASPAIESLEDIKVDIGPACARCKLCTLGRSQIVFGVGSPKARLMFVGEAPGEDEDKKGEPFVGRAGQLLTKIIEAIGMTRDQVYIANVIKCRPPGNRNPEPDEIAACEPFLFQQIDAVKPRVIVALGAFAAKTLLRTEDPISRLRGRVYDFRGAKLIPTFHPSFLLRSPDRKRDAWEDLKRARALLTVPVTGAE